MKEIKKLEDQIGEELHDAKKYIKCALNYKEENKPLADMYYKLANDEMGHMNTLHEMVVDIIQDYRDEHGEPPAEMMAVYNYIHEKHIDKAKDVKMLISMYK